MLDALMAYRDGGGRLIYLGGNGFYWRIVRHRKILTCLKYDGLRMDCELGHQNQANITMALMDPMVDYGGEMRDRLSSLLELGLLRRVYLLEKGINVSVLTLPLTGFLAESMMM